MTTVLAVGTEEGVLTLESNSSGSWRKASHALKGWEVTDFEVGPNGELLAATRGDGVWLSEDAGQSWRKPCYGKPGPGKVQCLCLDSATGRLYAGCEPIDLFVSEDLGSSWRLIDSVRSHPWVPEVTYPNKKVEPHLRDVVVDPQDPSVIYAALQVGFMLRSRDGGSTWQLLNEGLDGDVHVISVHPDHPRQVVIATGGDGARRGTAPGRALYRSDDGGDTWSPVGMNFHQTYSAPLVAQPGNPDVLFSSLAIGNSSRWKPPAMADSAVVRSHDGGLSWARVEDGLAQTSAGFAETLAFDPRDPEHLYAGFRDGHIYATENAGDTWQPVQLDGDLPSITELKVLHA
jgi:photosystem II stability/assembly factor-like uncharacterized protein